jgi:hypothetical protein
MFLPPGQSPTPPAAQPRSGGVLRALPDRILETLRYFSDEIELRQAGGLGEAQAAGYVAGRLRRADYAAAVQSFRTGAGERLPLALLMLFAAGCGALVVADRQPIVIVAALLGVVLALLLMLAEIEGPEPLRRLLRGKTSQSVVAGRAAAAKNAHTRVVILAPLDGPPQPSLGRQGVLLLLGALIAEGVGIIGVLAGGGSAWRVVVGLCSALIALAGVWLIGRRLLPMPLPAVHGAGELTTLLMLAEELDRLQTIEVWIVALGGSTVGHESIRALIERYPFAPGDTYVINLHHISAGQPVFVTREGVLRERRSDRVLFALASDADAADMAIDAAPRRLRQRTLAQSLMVRGFRTITISSHSPSSPYTSPDAQTIERCVRLVVGMIRRMDEPGREGG